MSECSSSNVALLPPKPMVPQPRDCCGTGCIPCVFDIYEQDLKAWKKTCDLIKNPINSEVCKSDDGQSIRKDIYTDFEITDIKSVSENTFLYKFLIPCNSELGIAVGQHIVVQQIWNGRNISRQYTPVSAVNVKGYFEILIKIYPKGKITQIIKNWEIGDKIPWRGPFGNFIYSLNMVNHIFMLAAGTGIAPMYQIIHSVLSNENDETTITLFYCSKSFNDILLRCQLLEFTSYWNFTMMHYLTDEKSCNDKKYKENVLLARLGKDMVKEELNKIKSKTFKVLLCGTKSFEKDMINACKDAEVLDENIFRF